ncbi:predicted protein, partial [Nematostella vectensis]
YEILEVNVNGGEKKLQGRLDSSSGEPYVPFSFVKEYFEIYGEVQKQKEKKVLEWRHSYSEIHESKFEYDPKGTFLWFQGYHVEGRLRVKCICGKEEVPVSSQWNPNGHYYPIQIAQYGLSHYSSYIAERDDTGKVKLFEDAESVFDSNWVVSEPNKVENIVDEERGSRVIKFWTQGFVGEGVSLHLDSSTKEYVLSFHLKQTGDVIITVSIETKHNTQHLIHYTSDEEMISVKQNEIFMGIGTWKGWRKITRNLDTDLRKGLRLSEKSPNKKPKNTPKFSVTEIQTITLKGSGCIDNITLSRSARLDFFMAAANWFVRNQDKNGGWPITVKRKIMEGVEMAPGWYSAMAQGQAMSLLTRAYYHTNNSVYLEAALKATSLFGVPANKGGVRAMFMDKYPWYEEYPTTPSLYVLNGFIYSLVGLHDLTLAAPKKTEAKAFFDDGMKSLKALLLMFDAGSGTFYDLRHVSMRAPPNLARWDYHTLHVSLLHFISGIDSDRVVKDTAVRWTGYTKGKRAKHN